MNQTSDLDRLLGDWLADGPNRAPDQPISAATQFARAHPRRPDPLRIFRSDPMADRRRSPFGLQPGLVFALLALVVAIVAAGVIGSRLERPVVVPPSNGQPAPSRPAQESPSSTPIASEPPSPFATVALNANGGRPATVDIFDLSGLVVDARSGPAADGVSIDGIVVTNDKADSIVITWDGSPCDTAHRLTVDATATHLVLELVHHLVDRREWVGTARAGAQDVLFGGEDDLDPVLDDRGARAAVLAELDLGFQEPRVVAGDLLDLLGGFLLEPLGDVCVMALDDDLHRAPFSCQKGMRFRPADLVFGPTLACWRFAAATAAAGRPLDSDEPVVTITPTLSRRARRARRGRTYS